LPTGDLFYILTSAATTGYTKGGIYPFIATAATVTKNVIAVSDFDFATPLAQ